MRHNTWALAIAMLVGLSLTSLTTNNAFAEDSSPVTKYPTAFSGASWSGSISDLDDLDSDCIGTTTGSSSLILTGFGFDLPYNAYNIVAEATVRLDTQSPTFGNPIIDVDFDLVADGDVLGTSSSFPEDTVAFCSPFGSPFTDTEMVTTGITLEQAGLLEIHVTRTLGDDVEVNEVFITLTFDTCDEGQIHDGEECVPICEDGETFDPEAEDEELQCIAPKKKGGNEDVWDTRPTFGMNPVKQDQLVINCGFGMDQSCFDLTDIWHTPFEKITINTGESHDFQLNILAQQRLKEAGFCLVPSVGSMEGELCIGASFDGNGNIIDTTITQKEGLVDESLIQISSTHEGAKYNVRINGVKFLDQPFYEVIGLYANDWQPLSTKQFLNEGLDVVGISYLPPLVTSIPTHQQTKMGESGMITLTRVDKFENVWATEDEILYTFNAYGTPEKLSPDVMTRITDETQMVMTRSNSNFQLLVDWSTDQAEQKMKEMYPNMFKEVEFSEIDNIFSHNIDYKDTKQILASTLFN